MGKPWSTNNMINIAINGVTNNHCKSSIIKRLNLKINNYINQKSSLGFTMDTKNK